MVGSCSSRKWALIWLFALGYHVKFSAHANDIRTRRYDNYHVVEISTGGRQSDKRTVEDILSKHCPVADCDMWKDDSDGKLHVMMAGENVQDVMHDLKGSNIFLSILSENVQSLIDKQKVEKHSRPSRDLSGKAGRVVGEYAPFKRILAWMEAVTQDLPEIAEMMSIGKTLNGRDMVLLKLGIPNGQRKWSLWLDGGIHAREWISPATVIFMADQLLGGYRSNESDVMSFLRTFDVYILPVLNVDGYIHTFAEDRLWRKNRRIYNETCIGVDLNRNWNFHWGEVSSSSNPCSSVYRGERPHSEPEVANVADFLLARREVFIGFISYHSYGQRFFTRWAYTADEVPDDNAEMIQLADEVVTAMTKVHCVVYTAGSSAHLMYAYSGGSADWAKGAADIKYSFLVELRDTNRNNVFHGFLLPDDQIIPTGEENWAGLKVVMMELGQKYGSLSLPEQRAPYVIVQTEENIVNKASLKDNIWHFIFVLSLVAQICSLV